MWDCPTLTPRLWVHHTCHCRSGCTRSSVQSTVGNIWWGKSYIHMIMLHIYTVFVLLLSTLSFDSSLANVPPHEVRREILNHWIRIIDLLNSANLKFHSISMTSLPTRISTGMLLYQVASQISLKAYYHRIGSPSWCLIWVNLKISIRQFLHMISSVVLRPKQK